MIHITNFSGYTENALNLEDLTPHHKEIIPLTENFKLNMSYKGIKNISHEQLNKLKDSSLSKSPLHPLPKPVIETILALLPVNILRHVVPVCKYFAVLITQGSTSDSHKFFYDPHTKIEGKDKNLISFFNLALQNNRHGGVERFVRSYYAIMLKENCNLTFLWACKVGHLEIFNLILNDKRLDPITCSAIVNACENGHHKILEILLKKWKSELTFGDTDTKKIALVKACGNGHHEIVEILLKEWQDKYLFAGNQAITLACKNGHRKVVELLLKDKRINPAAKVDSTIFAGDYQPLLQACYNGHHTIAELLLKDKRAIPYKGESSHKTFLSKLFSNSSDEELAYSTYVSNMFSISSGRGHLEVVKLLLKYGYNPKGSYAIREASRNGHDDIVSLLLEDGREHPDYPQGVKGDPDNCPIRLALKNKHINIVDLLLDDHRVDPSSSDNYLIQQASLYDQLQLVQRLLKDSRVVSNLINNQSFEIKCICGRDQVLRAGAIHTV